MFYHFGIQQIEAYTAQSLDNMENELQVVQICQGRYVIGNRLVAGGVAEAGDLPAAVSADSQRADVKRYPRRGRSQIIACGVCCEFHESPM